MFWADKIAKDIINSGKYQPYWVDDMKTPSGKIHVGSLRGVVIHDLIYKALLHMGVEATSTYVFDDHDPMDALPIYLDKPKWSKYLGQPLCSIPSPDGKADSYATYFAHEFIDVFHRIGCIPKIVWSSELYKTGRMNEGVRTCLDNTDIIRSIYEKLYKKPLPNDWYPFQVVCPRCGKESTTKVTGWDGKEVSFTCSVDAVTWTKGCECTGKTSPFSQKGTFVGKLSWKIEWPVKWKVIGVTIEGAGKDHMTAGGSHDVARFVCERVLKYPVPYPFAYEFFLIRGKKMSSSKGMGSSAKEISEILPPYLLRFLFTRTDYRQAIEFDPMGTMAISDLFDEYDRCWQAYIDGSDENLSRAFELAQVEKLPEKRPIFLPRFRDVANYMQLGNVSLQKKFGEIKGSTLTTQELSILKERERYAQVWIERYAPDKYHMQMLETLPKEVRQLTQKQQAYLRKTVDLVQRKTDDAALQADLYTLAKELAIAPKEAFAAIYLTFLGKTHGPRAGAFLLQYPKERVIARLKEAVEVQ